MSRFSFTIDGTPTPKARPRTDFTTGRIHEDAANAKIEKAIRNIAAKAFGPRDPWTGPVKLFVHAYFAIPASWSPKYCNAILHGETIYHDQRPDKDNIEKLVMDACNGVVWRDDGQVVLGGVVKQYATVARTEVTAELIVDSMGMPPLPTPSQVSREKITWAEVCQRRAATKAARQAANRERKAQAMTSGAKQFGRVFGRKK